MEVRARLYRGPLGSARRVCRRLPAGLRCPDAGAVQQQRYSRVVSGLQGDAKVRAVYWSCRGPTSLDRGDVCQRLPGGAGSGLAPRGPRPGPAARRRPRTCCAGGASALAAPWAGPTSTGTACRRRGKVGRASPLLRHASARITDHGSCAAGASTRHRPQQETNLFHLGQGRPETSSWCGCWPRTRGLAGLS